MQLAHKCLVKVETLSTTRNDKQTASNLAFANAGSIAMDATRQGKLIWGRSADGYVIRVDGRGTVRESPALRELGTSCLDGDVDARLTVDLSQCEFLDSTFLGCLVALQKLGTGVGQERFVIAAPVERRKALLSATVFDQFFNQTDVLPSPLPTR